MVRKSAAINHALTETELHEIHLAISALEAKMYPNDPNDAAEGSRLFTIGVFRNLIDPESVYTWIASKARELFTVQVEKGHGNI